MMDIHEADDLFLLDRQAKMCTQATLRSYQVRLERFIDFVTQDLGCTEFEDLTPDHINAWRRSLQEQRVKWVEHPTQRAVRGRLARSTMASYVAHVRGFVRFAVLRGWADQGLLASLKRIRVDLDASDRIMSEDDFRAIVVAAAQNCIERGNYRDVALIFFLADTAARAGEVSNLRIRDLDLEDCSATVRGKTGKRKVFFSEKTATALFAWLSLRPRVDHDHVFSSLAHHPRYRRQPLGSSGIFQVLTRLARQAGVKGRHGPHSIRHMVGARFVEKGNLALAAEKLGHSTTSVTAAFYAHIDDAKVREATQRLSLVENFNREDANEQQTEQGTDSSDGSGKRPRGRRDPGRHRDRRF
jgi:integrase